MKPLIDNFPDILNSALLTIELTILSILNWISNWLHFCFNENKQN